MKVNRAIKILLIAVVFALTATGAIGADKSYRVLDKDQKTVGYIKQDGRIFDKDWKVKGYIRNGNIYDKDWQRIGSIKPDKPKR